MAVNDDYKNGMASTENLLRSLLNLDSQPAVLFVDFFSLLSGSGQKTILSGQDVQSSLASWYDVPQVRLRRPLPNLAVPNLADVRVLDRSRPARRCFKR